MALSDIQIGILTILQRANGRILDLPRMDQVAEDDVYAAIEGLQQRKAVKVIGPPNLNSPIGMDVDELYLTEQGARLLRGARA